MNPGDIDVYTWKMLEAAATDRRSGFRYVNLCSVDANFRPQARLVVLRRVDIATRTLEFHTDIRSAKWPELEANPYATVLGFGTEEQIQLRLQGQVSLHLPGSNKAAKAWRHLPDWTRKTYTGGPPGDEAQSQASDADLMPDADEECGGQSVFGLLLFKTERMDWFRLQQPENQRALLAYDDLGTLTEARWVNP